MTKTKAAIKIVTALNENSPICLTVEGIRVTSSFELIRDAAEKPAAAD